MTRLVFSTLQVVVSIFLLVSCCPASLAAGEFDPYTVLGVGKSATQAEVKKVYKKLAREWHPDKNKSPGAEDMFIKITKSYELLSNEEKRANYDRYGETAGNQGYAQQRQQFQHFHDSFYFDESFFPYQFNKGSRDFADTKYMLHFSQYMNDIVPDSFKKPYLIKITSDWCFSCIHIEPVWKEVVQELEALVTRVMKNKPSQRQKKDLKIILRTAPPTQIHPDQPSFLRCNANDVFTFCNSRAPKKSFVEVTELTDITYTSNLVRLRPGHMNVVLVLTDAAKNALLSKFAKEVYSFTGSLTLHFSFLNLDKHKEWMESLLEFAQDAVQIDSDEGDSQHKADYTGYVLALNGHKKYLCLFKPVYTGEDLHVDSSRASSSSRDEAATCKKTASSSLQIHHKLDRLGLWMERLLEGTLPRYYIPSWPGLDKITTSK
ncbi:DnaJ-like subfamily C member 16 [Acipenser ruthenus]|uniref:DnaJ-like subfamily C member 16 n=1 Tax=Acipenser ruthenus TaxID=7906 RepID=A0A444UDS2_ACIRT|nr:DnaJ-like subfamily C member 16 [Acipenser ruthenus]